MVDFCFFFGFVRGARAFGRSSRAAVMARIAQARILHPLLTGVDYKMVKVVFRLSQLRKTFHQIHSTQRSRICHGLNVKNTLKSIIIIPTGSRRKPVKGLGCLQYQEICLYFRILYLKHPLSAIVLALTIF